MLTYTNRKLANSTSSSPYRRADVGLALVLFVAALLARQPLCSNDIFVSDAADYTRAISAGFWSQYLATDSIAALDFIRRYRSDTEFRLHPWGTLYQQNDGAALRHFHVPAGFYLPVLAERVGWNRFAQRWIVAVINSTTIAFIYLMLVGARVSKTIAFASALFLCFSPVLIVAGTMLSPHALFSLTAITCMFALCRWLEGKHTAWLAVAAIACGVSIATLELSPILLLSVFTTVVVWSWRSRALPERVPVKSAIAALVGSTAVALLLWPGGLLRGGYLLSYGVFVFQGIFRSSVYFQQRSLPSSVYRLGQDWIIGISLILLLGASLSVAIREKKSAHLLGFSVLSVLLVIQGLGNGFRNTTYASHAVFSITVTAALAMNIFKSRKQQADRWMMRAMLGLMILLTAGAVIGVFHVSPRIVNHDPERIAGAIEELQKTFMEGTTFVVSEDPQAFLTYAPAFHFFGSASVTSPSPEPWVNVDHYYLLFDREAAKPPGNIAFCNPGKLSDDGFLVSCRAL